MPIRDLFCIVEAVEKPSRAAMQQAVALAGAYKASASVLVAGPKTSAPYSVFSGAMVGELIQAENDKVRGRAEALAGEVKKEMSAAGVTGDVDICLEFFQDLLTRTKEFALCNDLTVIDRPGGVMERSQVLFEELLFGAGRPVLLPGTGAAIGKVSKIALAWDGSAYAARSLGHALSLFPDMKQADVVVVRGEKDLTGAVPAAKIAAHIERHGVKALVTELQAGKGGVADAIDGHAAKEADLIVMGAFGRSRLREFVLGGVTRKLSQTASRPLLLAH